jgi:sporulation protein YlmC with PRC-barrel domain
MNSINHNKMEERNKMEEANSNMDNVRSSHLEELKGSDFEIAEGMADILGWEITDDTGLIIGKVRDLLFDTNAKKVRYIITILEGDNEGVLIPIGKVELDEEQNLVIVPGLTLRQLRGLPMYIKDNLTPEDEYAIQHLFQFYESKKLEAEKRDKAYDVNTFYECESFNQDRFYKPKEDSEGEELN